MELAQLSQCMSQNPLSFSMKQHNHTARLSNCKTIHPTQNWVQYQDTCVVCPHKMQDKSMKISVLFLYKTYGVDQINLQGLEDPTALHFSSRRGNPCLADCCKTLALLPQDSNCSGLPPACLVCNTCTPSWQHTANGWYIEVCMQQ